MLSADIDVLILCGGTGTRLSSIVNDRPKPMVQIDERPFLDILIEYISGFGFKRFILCTGHKSEVIREYYCKKQTSYEVLISDEQHPLGTAGAVKSAEALIQSDTFMVANGDSFCSVNMDGFLKFHFDKKSLVSVSVVESENAADKGSIWLDDSQKIKVFQEKTKPSGKVYVNAGIYFCQKEVLSNICEGRKCSLEYEIFPELTKKSFYGYIVDGTIIDIGTPQRLQKAKNYFMQNR